MEKKKRHVFLRILVGLLVLILLGAAVLTVIPMTEQVSEKTAEHSADWMAELEDDKRLNELVLPGTHDSATQYVQLGYFSKCQALSIREQLEAGFRYLDIRLGFSDRELKLMHGFVNCKTGSMPWSGTLYLKELLEQCYDFLEAHPSEAVAFVVKHEHGDEPSAMVASALSKLIRENPEYWYAGTEIPTLAEARGKLVLFRRYGDRSITDDLTVDGIPMFWAEQGDSQDSTLHTEQVREPGFRLWVQDRYAYETEEKWNAFLAGLREPEILPEDLSLNFLSTKGSARFGHPYSYAMELNQRLLELPSQQLRGWVIVDFADALLASHIWQANFSPSP